MSYELLTGSGEDSRLFIQAAQPDSSLVQDGYIWVDTTNDLLMRATSPTTFVSTEGGSAAHDLFSATHGDVDETDTPSNGEVLTFNSVSGKWEAQAAGGHAQSHDHSAAGDGQTLTPDTLNIPNTASPAQTAEGQAVWDSDDDKLTVGTGAGRKTMLNEEDTPGGELGGTWASPTVDGTHSGSAHHDEDHAARHADGGADELAVQDLASDAATDGQVAKADGAGATAFEDDIAQVTFIVDGGGSAITTGTKVYGVPIEFDAVITQVTILLDQSATFTVDIWKDVYANYPPTNADTITGGNEPGTSASDKDQDATLTSWTTTITAGDVLAINVDANDNAQWASITLKLRKT